MQLPEITVPVTLPFDVPLMLHPVVVHFAVVLPVIILLIEIANLGFKRRALSVTSLLLLLLTVVVYAAAYFTGKADGSEAWPMLGDDAQAELKMHKLIGTYLVYAVAVPLLLKLLAMLVKARWAKILLILSLIGFIAGVFKQGHDGGELVYEYGVNVEVVSEARDELEEATGTIDELEAELEKAKTENATLAAQVAEYREKAAAVQSRPAAGDENVSAAPAGAVESDAGITAVDAAPADAEDKGHFIEELEAPVSSAASEAAPAADIVPEAVTEKADDAEAAANDAEQIADQDAAPAETAFDTNTTH